jgi:hypothetical protein
VRREAAVRSGIPHAVSAEINAPFCPAPSIPSI